MQKVSTSAQLLHCTLLSASEQEWHCAELGWLEFADVVESWLAAGAGEINPQHGQRGVRKASKLALACVPLDV